MTPPTAPPHCCSTSPGLPKQDDTLRDMREFIDELLADREQRREESITKDELRDDTEVIEEGSGGTVYLEYRTCGDETCHCMTDGEKHRPYTYRAYRDGNTVGRGYLEKADAE